MDQELIFKPNQIDKRHHLYKHLTSALAYAFFGSLISEEKPSDKWLQISIRERLGDRFTRHRCGTLLSRYHVMKRI